VDVTVGGETRTIDVTTDGRTRQPRWLNPSQLGKPVTVFCEGEHDVLCISEIFTETAREAQETKSPDPFRGYGVVGCGGCPSERQIEQIITQCKDSRIVLMFDADVALNEKGEPVGAGVGYTMKLAEICFKHGISCQVICWSTVRDMFSAGGGAKAIADNPKLDIDDIISSLPAGPGRTNFLKLIFGVALLDPITWASRLAVMDG
jgi:hypothetical protein